MNLRLGPAVSRVLLLLHSEDEELDLLPTKKRRCQPEDGLDDILKQLKRKHELNGDARLADL